MADRECQIQKARDLKDAIEGMEARMEVLDVEISERNVTANGTTFSFFKFIFTRFELTFWYFDVFKFFKICYVYNFCLLWKFKTDLKQQLEAIKQQLAVVEQEIHVRKEEHRQIETTLHNKQSEYLQMLEAQPSLLGVLKRK
jgi:hypothetical protein